MTKNEATRALCNLVNHVYLKGDNAALFNLARDLAWKLVKNLRDDELRAWVPELIERWKK